MFLIEKKACSCRIDKRYAQISSKSFQIDLGKNDLKRFNLLKCKGRPGISTSYENSSATAYHPFNYRFHYQLDMKRLNSEFSPNCSLGL